MGDKKRVIVKVRENKLSKQKLVTIPRKSNIKVGDYVLVEKLEVYK